MRVYFKGLATSLAQGVAQLADMLGLQIDHGGIVIEVIQEDGPLRVSCSGNQGVIHYQNNIHFYRALGLFIEHATTGDSFEVTERPRFEFNGTMLDVSRNGVMRVNTIK